MAYVSGTVNSDVLNAADGITSGNDEVHGGDGHDTIRGLGGDDDLYGEDGRDTLYGGDGGDLLDGGNKDDKLYGGDKGDALLGGFGQDELYGENGNDFLDGGPGADLLDGGDGQDFASYVWSDAGVHVSLAPVLPVGSGISGGDAEGDTLVSIEDLHGSRYDDEFYGNDQANQLLGNEGKDCLFGGGGEDQLAGGEGKDERDGGDGADFMAGGSGNDTYTVDDAGDVVAELAQEGVDTVDASINYTLGDDVENLVLTGGSSLSGTGNDLDNVIMGNDSDNLLSGGGGEDSLEGMGGADTLDGGDAADLMLGGSGNDTYTVDDAGDVVTEYVQEGIDTVDAVINYTLGDHVENLVLTGGSGLSGTGNDLDNVIMGNDSDNLLSGGEGEDSLEGRGGADTLDGGTGADTLIGGQGFDIFIVDDAGDVVLENAGEGFDQVQTSVSYSLAAGAEVEVLYADPATTSTAPISLIGNELDNLLTGNDGINVLVGGLGVDTLRGNGGGDAFLWSYIADTGLNNPDVVTDYSSAQGDVLHFTNMDADDTVAGNQDFTLIGTAAFTAPGQINWFTNGTDTFIQLNTDADLAADGVIQLNGVLSGNSVLMFL